MHYHNYVVEKIIFALLVTLASELFIYSAMDNFKMKSYWVMFIANIVLVTTMNVVLMVMPNLLAYLIAIVVAEILIYVGEALIFWWITKSSIWTAFLTSIIANTLSLGLGIYFNHSHPEKYKVLYYILIGSLALIILVQIGLVLYFFFKRKNEMIFNEGNKKME